MIPQLWFCPTCCVVGVVMYEKHEGVWEIGNRVRGAHVAYRPKCLASERVVVLENLKKDAILCTGR